MYTLAYSVRQPSCSNPRSRSDIPLRFRVTTHTQMSHYTHVNESLHTHKRVTTHTQTSHAPCEYAPLMSHHCISFSFSISISLSSSVSVQGIPVFPRFFFFPDWWKLVTSTKARSVEPALLFKGQALLGFQACKCVDTHPYRDPA